MDLTTSSYGFATDIDLPFAQAIDRVKAALADEGFGVLAEIDVAATLRNKLNVQIEPYTILGACNPPLAHQAIDAEPDIGLLLPCNVLVRADGQARTHVAAMDPVAALSLTGNDSITPIADAVKGKMERVLQALAS